MMKEPEMLSINGEELIYQFAGLNHFHWHKVFDKTGKRHYRRYY